MGLQLLLTAAFCRYMRILIITANADQAEFLRGSLVAELFSADVALDGASGSYLARTNDFDLVILDPGGLSKKAGADVCQEIRDSGKTVPILILSELEDVPSKISMFELGADDYVTKPFIFGELLARLRALLRRPKLFQSELLVVGDLLLDSGRHVVRRGDQEIYLTRKEFMLLEYLMRHCGNVVSRGMLMEHVWDINGDMLSNTIETHILNLRKKIHVRGRKKVIKTIPGRGYKIAM
jgi:DNA-binding response OmpR family regulator